MPVSAFGRNLKALREKKNLTQTELARLIGVSAVSLGNWETRGIARPKSQAVIDRLCEVLDCTEKDLFGISDGYYGNLATPKESFEYHVVSLDDDSMDKVIPSGFSVGVDASRKPRNDDLALISLDGSEPMVRFYKEDDGIVVLSPSSHDGGYHRQIIDTTAPDAPNVQVLGVVKQAFKEWKDGKE